jgi:hypothetical protein
MLNGDSDDDDDDELLLVGVFDAFVVVVDVDKIQLDEEGTNNVANANGNTNLAGIIVVLVFA